MKRRGREEGSVYFRADRNAWCAQIDLGLDERGKRKRKTVYAATKPALLEKLRQLQEQAARGELPKDAARLTVGQFLHRWLEDSAKLTLRPSTFSSYESLVRVHMIPTLGRIQLAKLTPLHLQNLYKSKLEAGLSPRTTRYIHAVIHRALKQALKWGLVSRNPADAVDPPTPAKKEIKVLTAEEAQMLLAASVGDRFHALYVLALTTGMRQGELLGLQWQDVDLRRSTLHVRRTLTELYDKRADDGPRVTLATGEPKTSRSRRTIVLPPMAVKALIEQRKRLMAEGLSASEWVFPDTTGGPVRKQNLVRRSFKPILQKAGLPDIRFHDLRHTAATLLLAAGEHPKIVQERLGHSQIALTMDTYSHVLPSMQKAAADRVQAILEGAGD
jgi:integrase